MIKPQKLKAGDKVATVSTAWGGPAAFPGRYRAGVRQLEAEFGLQVVEMPHTLSDDAWLERNPQARAADLMQAFADPSIRGIFATIGGDDSIRLLPYLDLELIRRNPKVFIGYSDVTVSHLACFKAGLVTFSGPMILSGFAESGGMFPYMVESVRRTLFSSAPIGEIRPNPQGWTVERSEWADPAAQARRRSLTPASGWKFLQGSRPRQGHLIGGCIEVLDWLRGAPVWPEPERWQGAILFLEGSEDAPSPLAVTWYLRALAAAGVLERLSGLLLARPGGPVPPEQFAAYDRAVLQVLRDEQGLDDLPVVTQMDFGHTDPMFTLPYGVQAEIDPLGQKFTILESAVTE